MTDETVLNISILKEHIVHLEYMKKNTDDVIDIEQANEDIEVFKAAIKALEQEPCSDAISRQEVLNEAFEVDTNEYGRIDVVGVDVINSLPPVTPQLNTGHWIDTGSGQECSECGEIQYGYDNFRRFCASCGAKMQVVEDGNK